MVSFAIVLLEIHVWYLSVCGGWVSFVGQVRTFADGTFAIVAEAVFVHCLCMCHCYDLYMLSSPCLLSRLMVCSYNVYVLFFAVRLFLCWSCSLDRSFSIRSRGLRVVRNDPRGS